MINPQALQQIALAHDRILRITAETVIVQTSDNMRGQIGSGIQYYGLPDKSSLSSGASPIELGQIPSVPESAEYSVVQSGHLVNHLDVRPSQLIAGYEFGYINVNMKQAITQELGSDTTAPRANIYRTIVSDVTKARIQEALKNG